ncbi:DUF1761 domain-containing protein [Fulvivirga lutea]|uniref:DUF1761 domain-containing protein n=1 Tax=Fulvivirga lutea TaxID=2810512 RepID=A0A974WL05_9BACT|nr:DUF1761 domain-containing protein [Fulvivirga lutea]QSE99157.1 DUF1761 domain-containing protein [Fulvivirga lutea]
MQNVDINYLAVVAAALSMFVIGGLWYSPILFGNAWAKENGFTPEFVQSGNKAKIFGGSLLLSLIIAFNLAGFISGFEEWTWGLIGGFLSGFGWVAMSIGILYLFERRSAKLFFINAGYFVFSFLVMGLILGLWK